jgi:hypothetical protein
MAWLRRETRLLFGGLALGLGVYLAGVLVNVTWYSRPITATLQCGFLGLYWGGQADVRNNWVYNWFSGPWDGCGAGADAPAGIAWFAASLDDFRPVTAAGLRHRFGGFLPRCGANPRLAPACAFQELIVPCWMPVGGLGLAGAFLLIRGRRRCGGSFSSTGTT